LKDFNWGVVGCGTIAGKFAEAVAGMEGIRIHGVADVSLEAAERFAGENAIGKVYQSTAALFGDGSLDAVYLAAPNTFHYPLTKAALLAGRNVLCEKPFVPAAGEARELVELAGERGLFLCDGLWTKTLPVYRKLRGLVAEGQIGDIRAVTADYFFRAPLDPESRLFSKALGGGALLDIGIYGLVLACMFLGCEPVDIRSTAYTGVTGVDEQAGILLRYENGAIANLLCSIRTPAPQKGVILGTGGRIEISDFGRAEKATVYIYDEENPNDSGSGLGKGVRRNLPGSRTVDIHLPHRINGFEYQIEAVVSAIREGKTECPLIPHQESIGLLKIMDACRSQW